MCFYCYSSLEDEAVQTYEDDSSHVPEPLIREVSWEVHPECSQGCSHAKLWDSEPDSEHITIKVNVRLFNSD